MNEGRCTIGPGEKVTRLAIAALVIVGIAFGPALACGCGEGSRVSTDKVRVGYLEDDLHQLAYYVAGQKGYFESEGLEVEEGGNFNGGPEEMSGFSAGELDVGYVGAAPAVIFSAQQMADILIVAQVNSNGSAIVVRNGFEAKDVSAFEGRTIAVPGFGTVQDFLLSLALEEVGLNEEDLNVVALKPEEMISALRSGQIDGAVAWEPYPSIAVLQNAGRVLVNSDEIWPDHPCCVLVADRQFASENPGTVRRVVSAHARATRYIDENFQESVDMGHLFTGQTHDVVEMAMGNIEFDYRPDIDGIERYAGFLKSKKVIKVDDVSSFARGLVDTGFLPQGGN